MKYLTYLLLCCATAFAQQTIKPSKAEFPKSEEVTAAIHQAVTALKNYETVLDDKALIALAPKGSVQAYRKIMSEVPSMLPTTDNTMRSAYNLTAWLIELDDANTNASTIAAHACMHALISAQSGESAAAGLNGGLCGTTEALALAISNASETMSHLALRQILAEETVLDEFVEAAASEHAAQH